MSAHDYVATGNVKNGEWMRRSQAEDEGVEYRELNESEAEEVDRQIEEG